MNPLTLDFPKSQNLVIPHRLTDVMSKGRSATKVEKII